MMPVNYNNHYWVVGGSETEVYSSASNSLVSVGDSTYVEWASTNKATTIASEAELADVLKSLNHLPAWVFSTPSFIQPSPGIYSKGQLTAYAADKRWQKEIGGITVSGVPVATDDRSKQMIMGARLAAQADSNWSTSWVAADGSIVLVNATTIIAISDAVQAHVNDCFTTFALVKADIDSGEITTTAEIDAAFAA